MQSEMFESSVRSAGDLAGVFEHDGEAGYFYLVALEAGCGQRVVDAIGVVGPTPDFLQADVSVRWSDGEPKVGLFIRGKLWAVFDLSDRTRHGGSYRVGSEPNIPSRIAEGFA